MSVDMNGNCSVRLFGIENKISFPKLDHRKFYDNTVPSSEFEFRKDKEFSFLRAVETGSVIHPASYLNATGDPFPGV
jgi:hypothetical protein